MNRFLILALPLALVACGKPSDPVAPEAAPASGVHMDAESQTRMGVRVAAIEAANAPRSTQGYARVMDVGPLAAIDAEVGAADAAAAASLEEYRRLSRLAAQDQAASRRAVEAARAQAAADSSRAMLASRRIGLEWGPGLERLGFAGRSRLLSEVAAGRAALLRIDAPDANAAVTRIAVYADENAPAIQVTLLGQAGPADARLQTAGVLGVVRGPQAHHLASGQLLRAVVELQSPESGFVIPGAALVRAGNSVWVYVKLAADRFEKRDVSAGRPLGDNWFVAGGFEGNEQIVVEGSASVLAAERGPVEAE